MTAQIGFSTAGQSQSQSQSQSQIGANASPEEQALFSSTATATPAEATQIQHPQPPSSPAFSLHTHRQSHNSSKLPAFRFTDFRIASAAALSHPSLAHHAHHPQNHAPTSPTSPGSPNPVTNNDSPSADRGLEDSEIDPDFDPQATIRGPSQPPIAPQTAGEKQADSAPASAIAPETQSEPAEPAPAPAPAPPDFDPALTTTVEAAAAITTTTTSVASRQEDNSDASAPPRPRSPPSTRPVSPTTADSIPAKRKQLKRPASFNGAPPTEDIAQSAHPTSATKKPRARRSFIVSRRSSSTDTASPLALDSQSASEQSPNTDSPTGQRELILPKTLKSPTDEKRSSLSNRPPVSYRPPPNSTNDQVATPVRVPPIRSFRSSGSRKSVVLDMNTRSRIYDMGDDPADSSHDRTLRALEGRFDDDDDHAAQMATPTANRRDPFDNDDTGDVFLKIAREESSRRKADDYIPSETQSVVSRVKRSHRRPLSSTVPTSNPTSPPQIPRRLSDQQDAPRVRNYDADRVSEVTRMSSYRTATREKAASVHPGEDLGRKRASISSLRPSPLAPRSMAYQENGPEHSLHSRRRSSITDSNATLQGRGASYKPPTFGHAHGKTYNSSPLVRSFDFRVQPAAAASEAPQAEGTESNGSTTAPSTVWDELDDIKTRIHRLELTGKLPPTSGAAMSRISDERPPTANTTVTTISSSPKRLKGAAGKATEVASTVAAPRETHPVLHAALTKSRPFINAEIFRALESAATEAMSLSSMMGTPGLPGPISSGASTIGAGTNLTDRQLRRKADSVCRSLTELCVALGEEVAKQKTNQPAQAVQPIQSIEVTQPTKAPQAPQIQAPQVNQPSQPAQPTQPTHLPQSEVPSTPTLTKSFSNLASQRRQSLAPDQSLARSNTSPRAMSKFEERRINLLSNGTFASSRISTSTPATPLDANPHRRSSLLVSRTRRAGTEEPDEGRRSSLLQLRNRRAVTEEPEEGRKTSLLVRNRRGTVGEDDDEVKFKTPSRSQTDLNLNPARMSTQSFDQTAQPHSAESNVQTPSILPRRRFLSSSFTPSRLATPSVSTNINPQRKYLERSTPDRESNNIPEKFPEERERGQQRYVSLGQTVLPNRSGSINRRSNRDSTYTMTSSTAATAGSYYR